MPGRNRTDSQRIARIQALARELDSPTPAEQHRALLALLTEARALIERLEDEGLHRKSRPAQSID